MAERRMLARGIMEEDLLLSLSAKLQIYYTHLILQADDDGFVDRIRSIRKMLGVREKDVQLLVDRGYLIPFESSVMAITHWHIHNRVRKDTYTPTKYTRERAALEIDATGIYRLRNDPVTDVEQECAVGKERVDKDSGVQERKRMDAIIRQARELGISDSFSVPVGEWFAYKASRGEEQSPATVHSTLVQIKRNLDQYGEDAVGELIRLSIRNGWRGIFFERLAGGDKSAPIEYGTPDDLFA